MSTNPINRFPSGMLGIIVAGGDNRPDPRKLGRVKVYYPVFGKVNWQDLPWVTTQSTPNDAGQHSFDRPPQEGTVVQGGNITDSGHSLVRGVINGIYEGSGAQLPNFDIVREARNLRPSQASGPPSTSSTTETNRSGAEKITLRTPSETPAKTIAERDGTFTPGTSPIFDVKHIPLKNIGTALQKAIEGISSGMNIPGVSFPDFSRLASAVPSSLQGAFNNMLGMMVSHTPSSGTNFVATGGGGNNFNYEEAANTLSSVSSVHELIETMENLISINTSNDSISIVEVEGPFGNVSVSVSANGNVYVETSNTVEMAMSAFESLVESIPSADSLNFLSGANGVGEIVKTLIYRLPVSEQSGLVEALRNKGTGVQKTLNDAARSWFGG